MPQSAVSREGLLARIRDLEQRLADYERRDGVTSQEIRLQDAVEQALDAYLASERRTRQVIDLVPHFIFAKDEEGRFLLVNQAVADVYGASVEELTGKTDADFNPDSEQVRRFRVADLNVIRGGMPLLIPEEVITDATGEKRWLQTVKIPFSEWGTGRGAMLGVSVDITEIKRTRDERDRLFDLSVDLLSVSNFAGHLVQVNPAWTQVLGWSADELEGKFWLELVHPEDHEATVRGWQSLKSGHSLIGFENRLLCKDGSYRWLSWNSFPTVAEDRIISVTRDITQAKASADENARLQSRLMHMQKLESLGLLAGGIAHDFNNLLQGILGNADLSLAMLPVESEVRPYVTDVVVSCQRAAELCQQMLAYSGRSRFLARSVDVNAAVEEIAHLIEVSLPPRISLQRLCPHGVPPVRADATQLRQVLLNLLSNSVDAIGGDAGRITVTTGVTQCDRAYLAQAYPDPDLPVGTYVYLEVADNGCGMDETVRERLFDPFFTTKFSGRGLGLSAVLGIVRAHKGAIRIRSETGKGSVLRVLLPASETDLLPRTPQRVPHDPEWRGEGVVLVVDDDSTVRALAKTVLEGAGFTVALAEDGLEGVEVFAQRHDELVAVLLDVTMPRMGGEQALREMRVLDPSVAVLISSACRADEAHERFTDPGMTGYVQKPYRPRDLLYELRMALDSP